MNEIFSDHCYLKADGFDEAIVGIDKTSERIVYNKELMIQVLMDRDEMSWEDAIEYLEYNVFCAYVGDHTPIYLDSIDLIDDL
jgi:hypothetical protein